MHWVFDVLGRYKLERLFKYGLVGIGAASTHAITSLMAYHIAHIAQTPSNFLGFLAGGLISYLGSYYFTFNVKSGHGKALPRFLIAWSAGIIVNIGVFKALLEIFAAPFILNVFVAIVLTPILQFLMLRFWAFRKSLDGRDLH